MNTTSFFDNYFENAQVNAMLVLATDGTILRMNTSFGRNFGYTPTSLLGQPFHILFNQADRDAGKPQQELLKVRNTGQADDENYLVDGRGRQVWCAGESILVHDSDGGSFIVKDVINLQAKKQLQLFLQERADILESIFDSSTGLPMMILDANLKVDRVNAAFLELFNLSEAPLPGSRLAQLNHPFWKGADIKQEVSNLLVTQVPFQSREVVVEGAAGSTRRVRLDSKVIDRPHGSGKKIFFIMEHLDDVPA